jgi:hypothetical protein
MGQQNCLNAAIPASHEGYVPHNITVDKIKALWEGE